jgi:hypothetical protein
MAEAMPLTKQCHQELFAQFDLEAEQMVVASILSHTRGDNAELATIIETSMKQAAEPDSKD